jgi:hypothetical protein
VYLLHRVTVVFLFSDTPSLEWFQAVIIGKFRPKRNAMSLRLLIVTALVFVSSSAIAAPISMGPTTFRGRAIQDVRILGNTPINPGPEFIIDDLYGDGYITIGRDTQSGDTIAFTDIDSVFVGTRPELGDFTFGAAGSVGVGSFLGAITNVVQDPSDPGFAAGDPSSLVSGDLEIDFPTFYFRFSNGLILETGAKITFTASLDGIPPRTPTLLEGRNVINEIPVYMGDPNDVANRILVGFSSDRRVEMIPEPSSMLLAAFALLGIGYHRRRRA